MNFKLHVHGTSLAEKAQQGQAPTQECRKSNIYHK